MNRPQPPGPPPSPVPGEVAWLRVADVNNTGAFLAWGQPRDLLLPFSEQVGRPQPGDWCLVFIDEDDEGRPYASMQLNDFIADQAEPCRGGQPVQLVIAERTELGVKAVVDHRWWGLIHNEDLGPTLRRGDVLQGWIRRQRDDGKLDLMLTPPARIAADELTERILAALQRNGGRLPLSDKSSPADIERAFGVSKGVFKQAIGALFRARRILIAPDHIRLTDDRA